MYNEKALQNCGFVKTALMLIIVFYHSIVFWSGTWFSAEPVITSLVFDVLSDWMNSFHIYGFVLVSGFLFYHLKFNLGKYQKYSRFIIKKIKRLIVPYAFASVLWVIPISCVFYIFDIRKMIEEYVLGISPSQLWFLLMLFVVFVVYWPLSNFFKERTFIGAGVVLIMYGIGLVWSILLPNYFQLSTALMYIPFFWIGFKLCQFGIEKTMKIPWYVWIFVDVFLFLSKIYVDKIDGLIFSLLSVGLNFLLHVAGALMAFFVLQKLANCVKWKNSKIVSIFSKNSMTVYLLHQQIIYFVVFYLNGVLNPYLHAAINFVISLTCSTLISVFLRKFKITRFMVGEK